MYKIKGLILWVFILVTAANSQEVSLEYIFQEPAIINARPSLKQISETGDKIYYYADDDYNGSLDLFSYNYSTGETFRFNDSLKTPSEFRLLPRGDALCIFEGDLFISRNFVNTNKFTNDLQITNSNSYEYQPEIAGNFVIYRRSGKYFATRFDTLY